MKNKGIFTALAVGVAAGFTLAKLGTKAVNVVVSSKQFQDLSDTVGGLVDALKEQQAFKRFEDMLNSCDFGCCNCAGDCECGDGCNCSDECDECCECDCGMECDGCNECEGHGECDDESIDPHTDEDEVISAEGLATELATEPPSEEDQLNGWEAEYENENK